jgi:hypothetical protein
MPYGPVPIDLVLPIFTMEAGIHAHDLLATCGRPEALSVEVVTATAIVLAAYLPILASAAEAEEPPAEGTVVALRSPSVDLRLRFSERAWAPANGHGPIDVIAADDDTSLLLFALGRAPVEVVHGSASAAGKFKAWFPGP